MCLCLLLLQATDSTGINTEICSRFMEFVSKAAMITKHSRWSLHVVMSTQVIAASVCVAQ